MRKFFKYKFFIVLSLFLVAIVLFYIGFYATSHVEVHSETETATSSKNTNVENLTDFESESETEVETQTETEIETENPEDLINMNSSHPYKLLVNRIQNRVVVYGIDYDGNYSIPYKGFICSTGAEGSETPLGTFSISDKYEWRLMVDGSYAQYATRIYKGIMFHSVPYYSASKSDLETDEYNKLGSCASLGCIRLSVADIKWIYDNCPKGSQVVVYDDVDEVFPITFSEPVIIPEDSPYSGWDPTDPDDRNPWKED